VWFSASPHYLDAEAFGDALFEVADLWTLTVEPDEYVHFLAALYHRITDLRSWIAPAPSNRIVTKFMWRKLRFVSPASTSIYAPFQYKNVTGRSWKEAVDVAHLIDDAEGSLLNQRAQALSIAARNKLFAGALSQQAFEKKRPGDDDDDDDENGKAGGASGTEGTTAELDPTHILSFLPAPPIEPPDVEFLSPPANIPSEPRAPMFSDPLRELGLAVLNTAEEDAAAADGFDADEGLGADWGDDDGGEEDEDADAELAWGAAGAGGDKAAKAKALALAKARKAAAAKGKGGKRGGALVDDYEPTQEEIDAFLASNPNGLSLKAGAVGGRDAAVKVLLLGQARTILKQRKRDAAIALAAQLRAKIEAAEAADRPPNVIVDAKSGQAARSGQTETNKSQFDFGGASTKPSPKVMNLGPGGGGGALGKRPGDRALSAEDVARRKAEFEAMQAEEAERQARAAEEEAAADAAAKAEAERARARQLAYEESLLPASEQADRAYLRDELPLSRTIEDPLLASVAPRTRWHGHSKRYTFLSPPNAANTPLSPHKAAVRRIQMQQQQQQQQQLDLQSSPQAPHRSPFGTPAAPSPQQQQPPHGTWSAATAPQRPRARAMSWPGIDYDAGAAPLLAAAAAASLQMSSAAAAAAKAAPRPPNPSLSNAVESSSSSDEDEAAEAAKGKLRVPLRRPTSGGSARGSASPRPAAAAAALVGSSALPAAAAAAPGIVASVVTLSSPSKSLSLARRSILFSSGIGLSSKPPPFAAMSALKQLAPHTNFTSRQRTPNVSIKVRTTPAPPKVKRVPSKQHRAKQLSTVTEAAGTEGDGEADATATATTAAAAPTDALLSMPPDDSDDEDDAAAAAAAAAADAAASASSVIPASNEPPVSPVAEEESIAAQQELDDFLSQLDATRLRQQQQQQQQQQHQRRASSAASTSLLASFTAAADASATPVPDASSTDADAAGAPTVAVVSPADASATDAAAEEDDSIDHDDVDGGIVIDPSAEDLFDPAELAALGGLQALSLYDDGDDDDEDIADEQHGGLAGLVVAPLGLALRRAGAPSPQNALRASVRARRVEQQRALGLEWHWGRTPLGRQRLIVSLAPNVWQKMWYLQTKMQEADEEANTKFKEKRKRKLAQKREAAAAAAASAAPAGSTLSLPTSPLRKGASLSAEASAALAAVFAAEKAASEAAAAAAATKEALLGSGGGAGDADDDTLGEDDDEALALLCSQDWEQSCALWGAKYEKGWKASLGSYMAGWAT
jgi:hypothetical protein